MVELGRVTPCELVQWIKKTILGKACWVWSYGAFFCSFILQYSSNTSCMLFYALPTSLTHALPTSLTHACWPLVLSPPLSMTDKHGGNARLEGLHMHAAFYPSIFLSCPNSILKLEEDRVKGSLTWAHAPTHAHTHTHTHTHTYTHTHTHTHTHITHTQTYTHVRTTHSINL